VPVLLSLAVHALLLSLAWLGPGWRERPLPPTEGTSFAGIALSICPPPRPRPLEKPVEQTFDVGIFTPRLVEAPLPAPSIPPTSVSAGTGPTVPSAGGSSTGNAGREAGRPGLLALPAAARSVVYVLDRSVSMGPSGALEAARREVLASLSRLSAEVRFQVIPYNRQAEPLPLARRAELVPADPATVARAAALLAEVWPAGGTDHGKALRRGLALRPDVLFLVTDADDLSQAEVSAVTRCNAGRTAIHVIELGGGAARPEAPLGQLAGANRGTYRRVRLGG
jgi:hypothetical protein